jgi:hypothetical protein
MGVNALHCYQCKNRRVRNGHFVGQKMDSSNNDDLYDTTAMDGVDEERLPRYMLPNFSSLLPEYANAETDQIRNAFSTGNFTSLQKIPAKLGMNAVNQARFEQMDENRLAQAKIGKIVTKNGLFNQFEYVASRYNLADELSQMERLQSDAKRTAISGKDFVSAGESKKLKFEDIFGDPKFRYPHLEEPYPDLLDEVRHKQWLEEKRVLHGAFVPGGRLPVDGITKMLAPDIIKEIHEVLASDWQDGVTFTISLTADDGYIAVRFEEASVKECENGLIAYMNVFCRTHWLASKYKLQKVAEDWNVKSGDGGLYFVFRPPWVKNRSRDMITLVTHK